jgi:hypothetical protein
VSSYAAVASVRWELPFVLSLPPGAYLCWEPDDGVAALLVEPGVGTLQWKRSCCFLKPQDAFAQLGEAQDPRTLPQHWYKEVCVQDTGRRLTTLELTPGPEGGFSEARPYSAVVLFLCLGRREDYADPHTGERASAALNNALTLYRFLSMDPLSRPLDWAQDCYDTVVSVASVPSDWPADSAEQVLRRVRELHFGTAIGKDRCQHIGLNSIEDLLPPGPLSDDALAIFAQRIRQPHELELFHELFLSAIRRMKRRELALAVVDAQSGFEAAVAAILREALLTQGKSPQDAEVEFAWGGTLAGLQNRLDRLDKIAASLQAAAGQPVRAFRGSKEDQVRRDDLYNLRNRIVHGGLRHVDFDEAKKALVAGLKGVYAIQSLTPSFNRKFVWSGAAIELPHVQRTAGRLFRMFEY